MINLIKVDNPDSFTYQKSYVSLDFVSNAFKFALISVSRKLKCVCQLIPQRNLDNDYCILSYSVIQYTDKFNLQEILQGTALNAVVNKNGIRILNTVVEAKVIQVSVVFKNSSDVLKWKSSKALPNLLNEILWLYVVVDSCLVVIPTSKISLTDVLYVCVHHTDQKTALRITHNTKVIIKELVSLSRFTQLCAGDEQFKIVGLENQIQFLNIVYNGQLTSKLFQLSTENNFVQKILIIGPSGCGKTRLVKHFAEQKKCGLIVIEGSDLTHSVPGKSENILFSLFEEAYQRSREQTNNVCFVLLDQIDNICRRPQSAASHLKRISCQLFNILETLNEYPGLIVVATTNNIHALDPDIRRSSRLEIEMYIGMPAEKQRLEILQLYCNDVEIKSSVCKKVAARTPGYVGADLALLVREVDRIRCKNSELYKSDSELLRLFGECLTKQPSSSLRSGLGITRFGNIQMHDLGGLANEKLCLKSYINWPLKHPKSFKRLGLSTPKGILLHGPPGCAKTSLACAVANTMNINFLTVSAAELYSPYVGEAERNVIDLFHKARINSPCIVFIDEIDALVGNRNASSKNVQCKIISTFLTEMDGVGNKLDVSGINKVITNRSENNEIIEDHLNNVIVIAATNRLDKLDAALLRPGRFDKLLFIGPPDLNDRLDILTTIVKQWKMPLANCVNLPEIAKITDRLTGADLTNLMKEAGYAALFENMAVSLVKQEHILHALKNVKTSLPTKKAKLYQMQ